MKKFIGLIFATIIVIVLQIPSYLLVNNGTLKMNFCGIFTLLLVAIAAQGIGRYIYKLFK